MDFIVSAPLIIVYVYVFNIYEDIRPGIFWNFLWISLVCAIYIQSLGHMLVWVSNQSFMMLIIYCSVFLTTGFLFNNFLINVRRLNYVYQFLSNFSLSRHSLEAFVLLVYGFDRCENGESQLMLKYMNLQDSNFLTSTIMIFLNVILVSFMNFYVQLRSSKCPQQPSVRINRILNHLQTIRTSKTS